MTNQSYLSKIGMEIKVARIRKGLSRQQVSELTGISQQAIGELERGKSDSKILTYKRIADALKVEVKDFL